MLSVQTIGHFRKYWNLSVRFFKEEDYPLATFFAITLIEEVGKIVILGNHSLSGELDKKGFRDHRKKYSYAVLHILLVNSRVSRIYGDDEKRFAKWFRDGELFTIRNNALYMEYSQTGVLLPEQVIPKEDAFLLVCISGEVFAEIQGTYTGTGADEWQQLLLEVDRFRQAYN